MFDVGGALARHLLACAPSDAWLLGVCDRAEGLSLSGGPPQKKKRIQRDLAGAFFSVGGGLAPNDVSTESTVKSFAAARA